MNRKMILLMVLFLLAGAVMLLVQPPAALAQDDNPTATPRRTVSDDEVNAVARGLYCPVCEGISLMDCSTQACADWREVIREKLAAGWNKAEIEEYFRTRYGDRVLEVPPDPLVYIIPAALILLAVVVFAVVLLNMQKPGAGKTTPLPLNDSDPYFQKVEEELRKRARK